MKNFLMGVAVALLLAMSPTMGTAHADGPSYWTWYEKTQGTAKVDSVKIKTACINAEDSAAHLHLIGYDHGTAVYGCAHVGY